MTTPNPADVHTGTHDHTGPDSACPACKPLADVLRDRMRWPSLHWGELHPDAYASLARAVHAAGYQLPVHTGTDRVELTDADIEQLADDLCRWHEDPDEVGDYTAPCDACRVQARCIAPFVAARMQALREERDRLRLAVDDQATRKNIARRSESDIEAKYLAAVGDLDAARAELAAANAELDRLAALKGRVDELAEYAERAQVAEARCAELEDALDIVKRLNDEVGAERDDAKRRSLHAMNQRDEERRMKEGNITALNKACAERDALQATLDRVTALADGWAHDGPDDSVQIFITRLRAALTPEGTE